MCVCVLSIYIEVLKKKIGDEIRKKKKIKKREKLKILKKKKIIYLAKKERNMKGGVE